MTQTRTLSKVLIVAIVLAFAVAGCTRAQRRDVGPKTGVGAAGGAAAGGLLGAVAGGDAASIAAGSLIGALAGGAIGNYLDQRDRQHMSQAAGYALDNSRTGTTTRWENPESGHQGSITPTETFRNQRGQTCRRFKQNVQVEGETYRGDGVACQQPDGSWKIVTQ